MYFLSNGAWKCEKVLFFTEWCDHFSLMYVSHPLGLRSYPERFPARSDEVAQVISTAALNCLPPVPVA